MRFSFVLWIPFFYSISYADKVSNDDRYNELSDDDFYKVLGVSLEATPEEIRNAFRKQSLKLHPDKNRNNPDANKQFQQLERAYSVFSNAEKREIYDYEGIEALEEEEKGGGRQGGHSIFDAFFGGGNSKPRGRDAHAEIAVTLEDLYIGTTKQIKMTRNVICRKCRATGAKDGQTTVCQRCQGRGIIIVHEEMAPGFIAEMQKHCPSCGGKGRTAAHKCSVCKGKRVVSEEKTLTIKVEPGMESNQEIVFEKQSEQRPGMTPGNVVVRLRQTPHPVFRRSGNDLYYEMHLQLSEALLGFQKEITHLDKHKVSLTNSTVVQPFQEQIVKHEGMPTRDGEYGALHVIYHIDFPKSINEKQRAIIEKILT